ncbi:hypothetical protein ASE86_08890 [Sphingomonas sp. Leaf33]|uniref:hypothetical protein n=1 Tax=Sphingomonas sp. Leaf33 TaxID=1736215 RepID=UPI0006FC3F8B|nr:hypothetical protein [Sphingomonas sp. Leaf33]KQN26246.1 hypothetical protein ASE86_08890 [Sphingomonas sp. Leaf33]
MSDDTPAEKAEARAIRRRWISIGEAVAVAGVVIAGLTFWSGWQDRQDAAADKAATRAEQTAQRQRVPLTTAAVDASGVELRAPADCSLESTEIRFPSAIGVDAQTTVATHRIETAWLEKPMLKLTDGGSDRRDGRIPVLITATCAADAGERSETAIYDLLWQTEAGGLIGGRSFVLRGLVRRQSGGDQRRLDAVWMGV